MSSNTADKVIKLALSQVGYLEKSKAAYKADPSVIYKFTEGAGEDNYTKYNKELHDIYPSQIYYPCAWCDCFVDWCFYQAFGVANAKNLLGGDFSGYTPTSAGFYKKKNAYFKTPKVGDQIFFKNDVRICHTGLVYAVDSKRVYTVEGNTSSGAEVIPNGGAVCKKSYELGNTRIDGYGRPNYDIAAKDGWVQDDGKWYYYQNGVMLKREWIHYDHHWYRVGTDGAMLTGWHKIYDKDGKLSQCYFDETEEFLGAEWHERSDGVGYLEVWTTND